MYEALSVRLILVVNLDSLRTLSLYLLISCSSGVMDPRGGLEASDLVSLGGVKLASEPLINEPRSVPRMLWVADAESRGPGQANNDLGPIAKAGSNCIATALMLTLLPKFKPIYPLQNPMIPNLSLASLQGESAVRREGWEGKVKRSSYQLPMQVTKEHSLTSDGVRLR